MMIHIIHFYLPMLIHQMFRFIHYAVNNTYIENKKYYDNTTCSGENIDQAYQLMVKMEEFGRNVINSRR